MLDVAILELSTLFIIYDYLDGSWILMKSKLE
jgi:hypothetical protein